MNALWNRADGAHEVGLLDVEIRSHIARGYVAGQHQERCAALGGLADSGNRIGQPRPRMHAAQRELARRFGIGVSHAGGIALVARGDQLNAGFHERMRNLEIGGAEQAEATACAVTGKVLRDNRSHGWVTSHSVSYRAAHQMSKFGNHVAIAGSSSRSASSKRL